MISTRFFLLLFYLGVFNTLLAQEFYFGRVSTAELREETDSVFPNVPAKIIYRQLKLEPGKGFEVFERIKIYGHEGIAYSNWELPFIGIEELQAFTYNLENDVIVKTPIPKESIFKESIIDDYEITKVTFTQVRKGSVIELKYKVNHGLGKIFTQENVPIKNLVVKIKNNNYLHLDIKTNPYSPIPLEKEENDNWLIFTGVNIPEIKNESLVDNINNYRGFIKIRRYREEVDENWGDLTNLFNGASWLGQQLEEKPFFKNDLKKIVKEEKDTLVVARKIFRYLQENMEYNDNYSLASRDIKKSYKEGKGTMGDINLILTAMLQYQGLRANPMVVACKHKGPVIEADVDSFNTLIAALQVGDEFYLLDASHKLADFGEITPDLMNSTGLIIRKDGTSITFPMGSRKHSNVTQIVNVSLDPASLKTSGNVKQKLTGHSAWSHREIFAEDSAYLFEKDLMDRVSLLTIEDYQADHLKDPAFPLAISYSFSLEEAIEEINGNLYFEPLLFFGEKENPFLEEERSYPIDLQFPQKQQVIITFRIPEGYSLESLPAGKKVVIEDSIGSLTYNANKAPGDMIQFILSIEINAGLIPPGYYKSLKTLYSEFVSISKSKIVLTKITN